MDIGLNNEKSPKIITIYTVNNAFNKIDILCPNEPLGFSPKLDFTTKKERRALFPLKAFWTKAGRDRFRLGRSNLKDLICLVPDFAISICIINQSVQIGLLKNILQQGHRFFFFE